MIVEVKSTRPTENIRTGSDAASKDLQRTLAKAFRQVDVTARLIQEQHPDFVAIPADNRIVGLVVTMDPFHVVNSLHIVACRRRRLCRSRSVMVQSLEHLVIVDDATGGEVILDYFDDPGKVDWSLGSALRQHSMTRNSILHAAWAALPWRSEDADELAP